MNKKLAKQFAKVYKETTGQAIKLERVVNNLTAEQFEDEDHDTHCDMADFTTKLLFLMNEYSYVMTDVEYSLKQKKKGKRK